MNQSFRRPQVSMLGSAEPGSVAYERAASAGELMATLGVTVVSGCGSPATRAAAERAIAWSNDRLPHPPDERQDSPILPWSTVEELESQLRKLGVVR